MASPGYYKTNPRSIRISELVRMWGLLRLPVTYLGTRCMAVRPVGWLPQLWAESACEASALGEEVLRGTEAARVELSGLGFVACGYLKATRVLNPYARENGMVMYLDASRVYIAMLAYTRIGMRGAEPRDRSDVVVAIGAVFEQNTLTYSNSRVGFDSLPENKVVRNTGATAGQLFDGLRKAVGGRTPRRFPDLQSVKDFSDALKVRQLEYGVRRGLYLPMTDAEVEEARRKLEQG